MNKTCMCGGRLPIGEGRGRPATYCSRACQQRAYRKRRASAIPEPMRAAARWVRHDAKRPITATGTPASSTKSATWTTYDTARASRVGDGLGFVLGAGFACIDIDHCLSDGVPDARAERLLEAHPDAYVEISPSGTGLHIWGLAPEGPGRTRSDFEFYSVGRYMTVPGNVYRKGGLPSLSI